MKTNTSIEVIISLGALLLGACSGGADGQWNAPQSEQGSASKQDGAQRDPEDSERADADDAEQSGSDDSEPKDTQANEPPQVAGDQSAMPSADVDVAEANDDGGGKGAIDADDIDLAGAELERADVAGSNDDSSGEDGNADPVAGLSPQELIERTVFRIEATGTFATPLSSENTSVTGGTGFLIDAGGYALTNAHVVSGATLLRAMFPGEERERNAQVVARAECSDLALLKIDGDEGEFAYLDWSGEPTELGTEVLAVGYPLGGDITLTSGIVSKGSTAAHTAWASVDDVVEHTATINPGSSGGPLLSSDYEVLGINYAGTSLDQYYAIGENEAQSIVQQLLEGRDVHSVGLTGTAVGDEQLSGIWVFAVQAGSPADRAGIEPGDLITHFGNLPLVPDERGIVTMEDYCDILRSHGEGATIDVRLVRWSTAEVLEGQLNGRTMEVVESGAVITVTEGDSTMATMTPATPGTTLLATHTTGSLSVRVPSTWNEVGSYTQTRYDDYPGHALVVAPDEEAFNTRYDAAGLMLTAWASTSASPDEVLDYYSFESECDTTTERESLSLGEYEGTYELYSGCPGDDSVITQMVLAAGDHTVHLTFQAITTEDIEALEGVLESLAVEADLLP